MNARYALLLITAINVFNYTDRMALSVLAPQIKADLSLTDSQLGLLIGFAFSLFYAVCGVPLARWSDQGNRVTIVSLCLAVWSVMTALSGTAQNFVQLLAARVGMGAGEAGCLPASQSLLCDYVPVERRPAAFAITNCGFILGMGMGLALSGWLAESVGWRWTFVLLGLPGLGLAAIVTATFYEPRKHGLPAGPPTGVQEPDLSLFGKVAILSRIRTYRMLLIYLMLNGFAQYGLLQWWPSYFSRNFDISTARVGAYLGIAIAVGSAIGLLGGGMLAGRVARTDISKPLKIGASAIAWALPTALASLFAPDYRIAIAFVLLTSLLWSLPTGSVMALAYSVANARMRATAGTMITVMTSLFGIGLGPVVVGLLSDFWTPALADRALRFALIAPTLAFPALAFNLLAASRSLAHDLQSGSRAWGCA